MHHVIVMLLKLYIISIAAGTQTLLTFPVNFDLYQLLGPGFNYLEEKSAAAAASTAAAAGGDIGNSSLRRKLFGQPDRQVTSLSSVIDVDALISLSLSLSRALFLSPPVSPVMGVMMYSQQHWNTLQHKPCHSLPYKIT